MERTHFDVAVVGAGPAGAAAALAARRRGARVLLLDRADFPRDKPCGDGIAAEALDVLAGLGVTGVADGYPPISRLRLVGPAGAAVARPLPRPAHTVPRRIFDARLVEAAVAAGADLRRHTVRAIRDEGLRGGIRDGGRTSGRARSIRGDRRTQPGDRSIARATHEDGPVWLDDRFIARATHDDGPVWLDDRFTADVVVAADGANSTIRRALGHAPNPDGHLAVAIRGYAPSDGTEQHIVTTSARWPAYAWSFPIGDGTANVGYGEVLRGTALSRSYLLERLARLLPGGDPVSLRAHHLPLSTRRPPPAAGRVLLAGDALSLINPFTGEGIFYAVLSGALAGAAAAAGPERVADRYAGALRRRLGRHLRHSGFAARLSQRPAVVDAAVRAARSDQAVFDRMVALGLGDGVFDLRTIGRIAGEMTRSRPVGA